MAPLDLTPENLQSVEFIAGRISPRRKHAWLVAGPKSGSTWLTLLLEKLLQWPVNSLTAFQYQRREQEIDVRPMLLNTHVDLLSTHQHCRFSESTRQFINLFNVKVILQTRNIYDTLVSYRDHIIKDPIVPAAYADENFKTLSPSRQLDFVIRFVLPWYFNFYTGWFTARAQGLCQYEWVSYEDLLTDPKSNVIRVLKFLNETKDVESIERQIAETMRTPGQTNFNVGRIGRGKEQLSQAQIETILEMRSFYPHIDFSPIGI